MPGPRLTDMLVSNQDACEILKETWPRMHRANVSKLLEGREVKPQMVRVNGRTMKLWPRREVERVRDEKAGVEGAS